ncbi:MAG: aminopeptidase P family protein [Clostridia bacterium]|nr:aminopeptidase P family protein [Clostridia bacterium]
MNQRIAALAATLDAKEAAIITAPSNILYYTGFPTDSGLLWITADDACFLTDFRYIEAAVRSVNGIRCEESNRFFADAQKALRGRGVSRVLLEDETVTIADRCRYARAAEGVELVGDHTLCHRIWGQRRVKDEREIAVMRRAQALTDDGFSYILPRLTVGRTEKDVALDLEFYMRRQGADSVAFDFIVASGENGSLPHAVPSDRPLRKGDFVTMDFGATVDGYRSDMTRTVAIGDVSDEQRLVYDTVLAAQQNCLSHLRAGLTGEEGDALARDIIKRAGYGDAFGHSTGHGVGIDIHEFPRMSTKVDTMLKVGEVVTVEPGIYLEGRFGVRIEDMVWLKENGIENLTASPKDLIIL